MKMLSHIIRRTIICLRIHNTFRLRTIWYLSLNLICNLLHLKLNFAFDPKSKLSFLWKWNKWKERLEGEKNLIYIQANKKLKTTGKIHDHPWNPRIISHSIDQNKNEIYRLLKEKSINRLLIFSVCLLFFLHSFYRKSL